jgi:glycosyltransferase involved in cell wall biosynthesis
VISCFNEEAAISLCYDTIIDILSALPEARNFELIFVDDSSKDNTLGVLREIANKDKRVHYISLSRNFGKEAAMLAGLQAAEGEYIVLLDADLQHPPALIPAMLEALVSGKNDCVAAKRTRRGDAYLQTFFARSFYRIITKLTGIELIDGAGDFRLMTRQYVDAILSLGERNRFLKGIYPWIGFKIKLIEYENVERVAGQTKWSISKLFAYSLDGMINTLVGSTIMFACYNALHLSYWVSSACNYGITSILSFFLNKYFTFNVRRWSLYMVAAFALTIVFSYMLAYGTSKPAMNYLLRNSPHKLRENIALFSGMCLFTVTNYMGQRLVVFKERK